jgi:hypothetical protein
MRKHCLDKWRDYYIRVVQRPLCMLALIQVVHTVIIMHQALPRTLKNLS